MTSAFLPENLTRSRSIRSLQTSVEGLYCGRRMLCTLLRHSMTWPQSRSGVPSSVVCRKKSSVPINRYCCCNRWQFLESSTPPTYTLNPKVLCVPLQVNCFSINPLTLDTTLPLVLHNEVSIKRQEIVKSMLPTPQTITKIFLKYQRETRIKPDGRRSHGKAWASSDHQFQTSQDPYHHQVARSSSLVSRGCVQGGHFLSPCWVRSWSHHSADADSLSASTTYKKNLNPNHETHFCMSFPSLRSTWWWCPEKKNIEIGGKSPNSHIWLLEMKSECCDQQGKKQPHLFAISTISSSEMDKGQEIKILKNRRKKFLYLPKHALC